MKAITKDGKRQTTVIRKVLSLRDKKALSWTNIRLALEKDGLKVSGSTVRRIYDEGKGYKGAHYESRPLPGGRYHNDAKPGEKPKPSAKTTKPVAKATARNTKTKQAARKTATKPAAAKATRVRKAATQPTTESKEAARRAAAAEAAEG